MERYLPNRDLLLPRARGGSLRAPSPRESSDSPLPPGSRGSAPESSRDRTRRARRADRTRRPIPLAGPGRPRPGAALSRSSGRRPHARRVPAKRSPGGRASMDRRPPRRIDPLVAGSLGGRTPGRGLGRSLHDPSGPIGMGPRRSERRPEDGLRRRRLRRAAASPGRTGIRERSRRSPTRARIPRLHRTVGRSRAHRHPSGRPALEHGRTVGLTRNRICARRPADPGNRSTPDLELTIRPELSRPVDVEPVFTLDSLDGRG